METPPRPCDGTGAAGDATQPMKAVLSVTWELSTEHPAGIYGQPGLVNRDTGQAYSPGNIVQVNERMRPMLALLAVRKLAQAAELDPAQRELVARFAGTVPPR